MTALQSLVSRSVDPLDSAVISVTKVRTLRRDGGRHIGGRDMGGGRGRDRGAETEEQRQGTYGKNSRNMLCPHHSARAAPSHVLPSLTMCFPPASQDSRRERLQRHPRHSRPGRHCENVRCRDEGEDGGEGEGAEELGGRCGEGGGRVGGERGGASLVALLLYHCSCPSHFLPTTPTPPSRALHT